MHAKSVLTERGWSAGDLDDARLSIHWNIKGEQGSTIGFGPSTLSLASNWFNNARNITDDKHSMGTTNFCRASPMYITLNPLGTFLLFNFSFVTREMSLSRIFSLDIIDMVSKGRKIRLNQ